MPGYKLYQNDRVWGTVPLPRIGSSDPTYLKVHRLREGLGHPLPNPPYPYRNWYYSHTLKVTKVGAWYFGGVKYSVVFGVDHGMLGEGPLQATLNRVYAAFKEEVTGETSSLGIAFAQWRQSFGMVANRAYQLARAGKALYRGRFSDFLNVLGIQPKKRHRRKKRNRPKEAAGLWLEYQFGWRPLAGDIFNAFQQLEEPLPVDTFAVGRQEIRLISNSVSDLAQKTLVYQRADVAIENPNLFLANQLGLVNIGEIVFDGIPFSFVLDWFTDCQTWISSFTDWVGLRVENPAISTVRTVFAERWVFPDRSGEPCKTSCSMFERKLGMIKPLPNFDVLANLGKSKTRAGNAMALLTQILSRF